ncbi:molecular chaperone [Thiovulum sp. ES]|nr:molecular chaperone [Thiovulum sp. ES]
MAEELEFTEANGKTISIDFGTTNSVVSYFDKGQIEQVLFKKKKIIPTALFFEDSKKIVFGSRAIAKGAVKPELLLKEFKSDIGSSTKYTFAFNSDEVETKINFVIDTNIFIDAPEILKEFGKSDFVRLPNKVVDELHNLANNPDIEVSAKEAMKSIDDLKDSGNIFFEDSNLDILPDDLEKDTKNSENDNRVLSIAKTFTDLNPETYLITNDKGLKVKAEDVVGGIKTVSLIDFRALKGKEQVKNSSDLTITPKDASRIFLQHLKEESEKYLKDYIEKAVITVPANFNPSQITIIKEAGEEAGFGEVRIQKEPVSAGLSYAIESEADKRILVFDFGGGTLDCSILETEKNGKDIDIKVVGANGNNSLGGKDVTKKLTELIFEKILDEHDIDMFDKDESELSEKDYNTNVAFVLSSAENTKIELSEFEQTEIQISDFKTQNGNINLSYTITRREFESAITEIRKEALDVVKDLMSGLNFMADDIDEVVLAGGSSNIPSIRDSLIDTLGKTPSFTQDTSTVISKGGVIEAVRTWGSEDGIDDKSFESDEAIKDFGVAIRGHQFFELISEGTDLPVSFTKDFQTERDDQENINVEIYNRNSRVFGKSSRVFDKGVDFIDTIQFSGIPKAKAGELTIRVEFELGRDDTLLVSAEVFHRDGTKVDSRDISIKGNSDV